jgi:nitrilase
MKIKVAVVQESPIFFNKPKTLEKLANIVGNYAKQGCKLLVFPESFIPGYPRGFDFGAVIGSRTLEGKNYTQNIVQKALIWVLRTGIFWKK